MTHSTPTQPTFSEWLATNIPDPELREHLFKNATSYADGTAMLQLVAESRAANNGTPEEKAAFTKKADEHCRRLCAAFLQGAIVALAPREAVVPKESRIVTLQ